MNIGFKIKKKRKDEGLTQEELAAKCNLSKNAIWNYENNKRKPNIEILTTIATALNVSISELLKDESTLTAKLTSFIDQEVFPHCDAENTLELISEDIDLDFDALSNALNNDEELSESYLVAMINLINKQDNNLFLKFYDDNKKNINDNYMMCSKRCHEIINLITLSKGLNELDSELKKSQIIFKNHGIIGKQINTNNIENLKISDIKEIIFSDLVIAMSLAENSDEINYCLDDFSEDELREISEFMYISYKLKVNEILNRHKK